MLTRRQLRELHPEDIPLHIIEEDYVQTIVLKGIFSKFDFLALKGGTCLRKTQGLNRFSEDLDFNLSDKEVKKAIRAGLEGLRRVGIKSSLKSWKEKPGVFLGKIQYQGPLYTGENISKGSIELDLAKFKPLRRLEWQTIISEYPDTGTFSIQSMSLEEILAEKLRSLRQRMRARDLYDIWFLVKKGVAVDKGLVNEKLLEVGENEVERVKTLVEDYGITREGWKRDLGSLMVRVPKLSKIRSEVLQALSKES